MDWLSKIINRRERGRNQSIWRPRSSRMTAKCKNSRSQSSTAHLHCASSIEKFMSWIEPLPFSSRFGSCCASGFVYGLTPRPIRGKLDLNNTFSNHKQASTSPPARLLNHQRDRVLESQPPHFSLIIRIAQQYAPGNARGVGLSQTVSVLLIDMTLEPARTLYLPTRLRLSLKLL